MQNFCEKVVMLLVLRWFGTKTCKNSTRQTRRNGRTIMSWTCTSGHCCLKLKLKCYWAGKVRTL